jgi:alcohol dehydrogenase
MRAIVLNGYGGNDRLSLADVPEPRVGYGQLLIRATHAGLNPVDFKLRDGALRAIRKLRFPHVMGNECAGHVVDVGTGVTGFAPGDAVFTRVEKARMGAFAPLVVEDAALVAKAPRGLPLEVAAGVPLVALTAWQTLFEAFQLRAGQRVLVHGGAGAVGRIALQLARDAGADVTTTVGGWALELARSLGATTALDYRKDRFDARGESYDLVVDGVGGETLERSFAVVKRGGMVVSIAGVPEPRTADDLGAGLPIRALFWLISAKLRRRARKAGARYRYLFMHPDGARLAEIASRIETGKLVVGVDRVFPATDFAAAFAYQESGKARGKVVLDLSVLG